MAKTGNTFSDINKKKLIDLMRDMANATVPNYNKKFKSENYVKSKLEMNLKTEEEKKVQPSDQKNDMENYVPIKDKLQEVISSRKSDEPTFRD